MKDRKNFLRLLCRHNEIFRPLRHFSAMYMGKVHEAWQTALLVAGHDPPIDITIYVNISINRGLQLWNTIETLVTNRTETKL